MEYYRPRTIKEALDFYEDGRMYIAGGTDLGVLFSDFILEPEALVDLTLIEKLSGIIKTNDGIVIGACTLASDIAEAEILPACLRQGAGAIGSPQIRNMATIGGNICNASPCGDTLAPLIVLEAVFTIIGKGGERQAAAEDFFTGPKKTILKPGEILKEVFIPAGSIESGISGFRMIGKRNGQAISQVNAAVWARFEGGKIEDIRVAAGSVAPVPLRLKKTGAAVRGKAFTGDGDLQVLMAALKKAAEEEIKPISDVRAAENYRRNVTGALLEGIMGDLISGEAEQHEN
jgi:carbon-monoxide dehydrogenase medium subunit